MVYSINKNIRKSPNACKSFMDLAANVFDLHFYSWYKNGYWQDEYIPYTLFDGDKAVANISANTIKTLVNGQPKLYLQLGTVMTEPEYRNRGLIRILMKELLSDFKSQCDSIYLYANDSVLQFYPKFGFEKATEYSFKKPLIAQPKSYFKLDMENKNDVSFFNQQYIIGNPFSNRQMIGNFGLIMFYCGAFLKDCVYYLAQYDCVVIASFDGEVMTCYDIFCKPGKNMTDILSAIAKETTKTVSLGFMPIAVLEYTIDEIISEDQLFVYSKKENPFQQEKILLPLLSHA